MIYKFVPSVSSHDSPTIVPSAIAIYNVGFTSLTSKNNSHEPLVLSLGQLAFPILVGYIRYINVKSTFMFLSLFLASELVPFTFLFFFFLVVFSYAELPEANP